MSKDIVLLASGDTKQRFNAARFPVFSTQRDWLTWRDVRTKGIYNRLHWLQASVESELLERGDP